MCSWWWWRSVTGMRHADALSIYPASLVGSHGRIAAYRDALEKAEDALAAAYPYVNGVLLDHSNAPWRRETAEKVLGEIKRTSKLIRAELDG